MAKHWNTIQDFVDGNQYQIKALDAEIARLQNSLPKLDLKEFEATCERINQLEIKRVQLLNPIENEQPLPTFKILTK